MPAIKRIGHDEEAPLVDHLTELRARIFASLAAFGVAFGLCLWQNGMLLELLRTPIGDRELLTIGVAEPFTTTLSVAAYAAIVLALPVLLFQVYAFTMPALAPDQQRATRALTLVVPVLFIAGAAFAFLVVVVAPTREGGSSARSSSSSTLPVTASLNSRIPRPSERPISGSRLAPKRRSRTAKTMTSSHTLSGPGMARW